MVISLIHWKSKYRYRTLGSCSYALWLMVEILGLGAKVFESHFCITKLTISYFLNKNQRKKITDTVSVILHSFYTR